MKRMKRDTFLNINRLDFHLYGEKKKRNTAEFKECLKILKGDLNQANEHVLEVFQGKRNKERSLSNSLALDFHHRFLYILFLLTKIKLIKTLLCQLMTGKLLLHS